MTFLDLLLQGGKIINTIIPYLFCGKINIISSAVFVTILAILAALSSLYKLIMYPYSLHDDKFIGMLTFHWRHNDHDVVSIHQPHDCLLNRLFRRRSKKTSKLRVTGPLCREFTGTGEFPAQRASYTENVFIWWRHHELVTSCHLHLIISCV